MQTVELISNGLTLHRNMSSTATELADKYREKMFDLQAYFDNNNVASYDISVLVDGEVYSSVKRSTS